MGTFFEDITWPSGRERFDKNVAKAFEQLLESRSFDKAQDDIKKRFIDLAGNDRKTRVKNTSFHGDKHKHNSH